MERNDRDLKIRKMAQDAGLDEDLESMVPPTSGKTTNLILVAMLCLIVIGALVAYSQIS